jgi:hypothetical protein
MLGWPLLALAALNGDKVSAVAVAGGAGEAD